MDNQNQKIDSLTKQLEKGKLGNQGVGKRSKFSSTIINTMVTLVCTAISIIVLILTVPTLKAKFDAAINNYFNKFYSNSDDLLEILICKMPNKSMENSSIVGDELYELVDKFSREELPIRVIYDKNSNPITENEAATRLKKSNADIILYGYSFEKDSNSLITEFKSKIRPEYNSNYQLLDECDLNKEILHTDFSDLLSDQFTIGEHGLKDWLRFVHNFGQNRYAAANAYLELNLGQQLLCASRRDSSKMFEQLGNAFYMVGSYTKSVGHFENALRLNPIENRGHPILACAYFEDEKYNESIDQYSKLIMNDTQNDAQNDAWYRGRAYAYSLAGFERRAKSDIKMALDINPNSFKNYNTLARILIRADANKGLAACRKAIELNPNNSQSYSILGEFYHDTWQYDLASESYRKAILNGSDSPAIHKNLINVDRTHSEHGYEELIRMYPNDESFYNKRARWYISNKKYNKAYGDLEKAIKINPNNVSTHFSIFEVFEKKNQLLKALDYLNRAEILDPDYRNYDFFRKKVKKKMV